MNANPEDLATAEEGVRALIRLMGDDPLRPGVRDTPSRVVRAYVDLCERNTEPRILLERVFEMENSDSEFILVKDIPFTSLCEHHLMPFTGTATVAYIPGGEAVVGLSKIPRLIQYFAARPQMQERLTRNVCDALDEFLHPRGVASIIRGNHTCMTLRGVKSIGAEMITSHLSGQFRNDSLLADRFFRMAGH